MKVIVAYWMDEHGNPKSIERISSTAADLHRFLKEVHPESRIKWFEEPFHAIHYPERQEEHWWKDGFEYLQYLLDKDSLGRICALIQYYNAENNYAGHLYRYGFQVRNLH